MAKLSYKVSYYVMYACIAISLVVLALFYFVGYTNPMGEYNAPEHTDTLIYWIYAILFVCIAVTLIGALAQFVQALKDNPKNALKSLLWLILFVVVLIVCYAIASSDPVALADGTVYDDVTWLKLSDMFIFASYFLGAVAAIATLVNLTGIFKK